MANVNTDVRSLNWKLWHGQIDRALGQLGPMTNEFAKLRERQSFSDARAAPGVPLADLSPLKQKRIINYGACCRSGRRVATALAESAANSLVARRMVKKQQM